MIRRSFLCVLASTLASAAFASAIQDEVELAEELESAKLIFVEGRFPEAAVALGGLVAKLEQSRGERKPSTILIDAHFHLGLSYYALNAEDAALESFRNAIRHDPQLPIDPTRYAPRVVELFERAREEVGREATGSSGPQEAGATEERDSDPDPDRDGSRTALALGAGGAGAVLGALVSRGSEARSPAASDARDGDGDGFAAAAGDCDDSNPRIHPDGRAVLRVTYGFTGTVSCTTANPRQQLYEVENNSCQPLAILDLERLVTTFDTQERRTSILRSSLPVEVYLVPPAKTTVIRRGAPAGSTEALCRDLSLANPFSRPRGDLRVDETYVVRTAGGEELTASNSFIVLNTIECTFCSLDSIFGPYSQRSLPFAWRTELSVQEGSGRVVVDGDHVFTVAPGTTTLSASLAAEDVRVEAVLLSARGAGSWSFDFEASERFRRGSLAVIEGDVTLLTAGVVRFRLRGEAGERITFRLRLSPP